MPPLKKAVISLCIFFLASFSLAEAGAASARDSSGSIVLLDDAGHQLSLSQPASRLVVLGPNLVESLYAVGRGDRIVGVSAYSDYPAAAKNIARVASHNTVNYELIAQLSPDLVLVWQSGFGGEVIDKLRRLGFNVFVSEPSTLLDIERLLRQLGRLTGADKLADQAAGHYRERLGFLRRHYARVQPLGVFYQVWHEPLQTLNGRHIVSSVIELCGGYNLFSALPQIAPKISVESVIAANPAVIIASSSDGRRPEVLEDWRRWSMIDAVRREQLHSVDADILVRHAPRILQGAEQVCKIVAGAADGA